MEHLSGERGSVAARTISAIAAAGALTAGALGLTHHGARPTAEAAPVATSSTAEALTTTTVSDQEMQVIWNALTASESTKADCGQIVSQVEGSQAAQAFEPTPDGKKMIIWKIGARASVTSDPKNLDARQASTDLSTPLKEAYNLANTTDFNKEAARLDVEDAICRDPVLGSAFANIFTRMVVEGKKVVDLNSDWLSDFAGDAKVVNGQIEKYLNLNVDFATLESTNLQYQNIAERLIYLLNQFKPMGVENIKASLTFQLKNGNLVASDNASPEVEPDTQDNLPAFVLVVDTKENQCLAEIGVNTQDKRPEEEQCATPVPVTTPSASTPPQTAPRPHTPGTTPSRTTTTFIGPKGPAHPPVGPMPDTTVEPPKHGPPIPTTSTTAPRPTTTESTIVPPSTTPTTAPPGGCGKNCNV